MTVAVLVSGASGTLGREVVAAIQADNRLALAGTADRSAFFAADAAADVVVDFSSPPMLGRTLSYALKRGLPVVIGTTGIDEQLQAAIDRAAAEIAICQAVNFSLGAVLLADLARRAARCLPEGFDVEIVEAHHRRKVDAPSGTALALGAELARERGGQGALEAVFDRHLAHRPRGAREIGYHAIRGGGVVGDHSVYFLGDSEQLELTHRTLDRAVFARGALLAARRMVGRPPGSVSFTELVLAPD